MLSFTSRSLYVITSTTWKTLSSYSGVGWRDGMIIMVDVDLWLGVCRVFADDRVTSATVPRLHRRCIYNLYTLSYNKKLRHCREHVASDFGTNRKLICDFLLVNNANIIYLLSCTVFKLWLIVDEIFASDRGVPHVNVIAGGDPLRICG